MDVTDLGDEHSPEDPADASNPLDLLIARVTLEAHVDARVGLHDLALVEFDQLAQRLDPIRVGVGELQLVEPALPAGPPDPLRLGDHSFLAEHLMHLALQSGLHPGQLVAVTHFLAQLAHFRRRHPRLRQSSHPQQIGQQGGVADVVLHPPIGVTGDAQRMSQVQPGAALGDHVGRPVPPPACFHRHLRLRTAGGGDLPSQVDGAVVEPTPPHARLPSSSNTTTTDRCRCRSIPTYDPTMSLLARWV